MKYQTQSVILRGGLCGPIWWPVGAMCGKSISDDFQGRMKRFSTPASFRDGLNSLLCSGGGDFQAAAFTVDSEIVISRVCLTSTGKKTHTRVIPILSIAPDMVNQDHYSSDFNGEY